MLIKEQVPVVVSPQPNSFAGLMELYETNYIQLHLLLGNLRSLADERLVELPEHLPLLLQVKERSRHTTTLFMTYRFSGGELDTRPDLVIRICHDALQAEVVSHRCRLSDQRVSPHQVEIDGILQCRWRMNRFLFKWLGYLRRQGYPFNSV